MTPILEKIDQSRVQIARATSPSKKSELGQFMTPSPIAQFMAEMFDEFSSEDISVLDPGAGIGSLSAAFCERHACKNNDLHVAAFELDGTLHGYLKESLEAVGTISSNIIGGDFIEHAVSTLIPKGNRFTHVILNPPYKKIRSNSEHRLLLRQVGIETVNLYSAFTALAIKLLKDGGQMVAILPRSFCNGPYYKPFRKLILDECVIRKIHVFESRTTAFNDDDVLQENVIVHFEKGGSQSDVEVSVSTDPTFSDFETFTWPFAKIVPDLSGEFFFHVPLSRSGNETELPPKAQYSLTELGIGVSTGPVVDFRMKEHLRKNSTAGSVPLLYPAHFKEMEVSWPKNDFKKYNAIMANEETRKWFFPAGHYTVVRRFSSKEERRRIYASLVDPGKLGKPKVIGFENHLNVFHKNKAGLNKYLALGLAIYLNTSVVDRYFRTFNGHTQVNATDLRQLLYPSVDDLEKVGAWVQTQDSPDQEALEKKFEKILWN